MTETPTPKALPVVAPKALQTTVPVAVRLNHINEYYFAGKLEQIRRMNSNGEDVINLGIGSPDQTPPPAAITEAQSYLQDAKSHGYASYTGLPELRQALADWYSSVYSVVMNPNTEILPLLGSKEGIHYISMAFLNPGDGVLVPNPGYPAYAGLTEIAGAKKIYYDLDEKNHWQPDFSQLQALMDNQGGRHENKHNQLGAKIKLMWVNYPHMPTGAQAQTKTLERLVEFAKQNQILICYDNPYSLTLTQEPLSLLRFDPKFEHCLELNTFSKSFNMAGWRVGALFGKAENVKAVLKVKSNVDSGMFTPIQRGAMAALKAPLQWHEERNKEYRHRQELVFQLFDQLGFRYLQDQAGLFVWAKAPDSVKNIESYCDELLMEKRIFIVPGQVFGSNGNRYARASLCSSRLAEALGRIK